MTSAPSWTPRAGDPRVSLDDADRARKAPFERTAHDELPAAPHQFIAHLDDQAAALAALTDGRA